MNVKLFIDGLFRNFIIFAFFFVTCNLLLKSYNVPFQLDKQYFLFLLFSFSIYPLCGKKYWSQNRIIYLPISKEKAINALFLTLASQGFRIDYIDETALKIKASTILKFSYFNSTAIEITISKNKTEQTTLNVTIITNSFSIGMKSTLDSFEKGLKLVTRNF